MTFQIINSETNKAIALKEFDTLYHQFSNIEENSYRWGNWFYLLEGVFYLFGDIADYGKETRIYRERLRIKDSRTISLHQAAQLLIVHQGLMLFENESLETMEYIKDSVNFFQHYNKNYYFVFSF